MDFCNCNVYNKNMINCNSIILTGVKHCGKTTIGKLLAKRLDYLFFDTDEVIQKVTKKSVRDLYNEFGVSTFMQTETKVCHLLAEKFKEKRIVISTGGGICDNPQALIELSPLGKIVFLDTDEETIIQRVFADAKYNATTNTVIGIPAYIAKKQPKSVEEAIVFFKKIYEERVEVYKKAADIIFQMESDSAEKNLIKLLGVLS